MIQKNLSINAGSPHPMTARLTLKVGEAASLLGVSTSTVRRLIARGFLKPLRQLRHLLIPVDQVNALVAVETTRSPTVGRRRAEPTGPQLRSPGQTAQGDDFTGMNWHEDLAENGLEKGGEKAMSHLHDV